MNSFTGVILFALLVIVSLTMVSLANRTQTRNRMVRVKTQQMRRRITDLEEMCATIEPLLDTTIVPALINEEIINLVESIKKLDPNASYLDINLQQAQDSIENFQSVRRPQQIYRLMPSDAAIARAKYQLNEAARIVRRHVTVGHLEAAELDNYIEELAWAHLMVDVISHIGHGHRAVSRGDHFGAYNFYRKSLNLLISSHLNDQRRTRMIKELSEILKNKRTSLSPELMPESEYNPTENTKSLPDEADEEESDEGNREEIASNPVNNINKA